MNVVVFIDGVMRGGFGQPLKGGIALYKALTAEHRVLLIGHDVEKDKRWLGEEGIADYAHLLALDPLDVEEKCAWRTLGALRIRGRIDAVYLADFALVREVFSLGYDLYLYISPAFTRPSWRPDARKAQGPTPWEAFTEEVQAQRRAAAAIAPLEDE